MTQIKICGIRRSEDIDFVNEARPEYIGFVFAPSKRQVNFDEAKILSQQLHADIKKVGVFVDETEVEILKLLSNGIIDIVQLHGSESEEYIKSLQLKTNAKIIKAFEIVEESDINKAISSNADYILLDSGKGSGKTFDWTMNIKKTSKPVFLAGGISTENVTQAIEMFAPFAVDVSSSVEIDGLKNKQKIIDFIDRVRNYKPKIEGVGINE